MSDLSSTDWSETDASNNSPPPNGWPEGQNPYTVNDCARAMMGALKRTWNRDHASANVTVGGSANAITLTYGASPLSYVQGEKFAFKATANNTGPTTVQVGSLAATNLFKKTGTGVAALTGGEIHAGDIVEIEYDGTQFQITSSIPAVLTSISFLRGYLSGLILSNDGGNPNTVVDISAGVCIDDANAFLMSGGPVTVNFGTNGAGGLDTGALANNTWYHVFAISKADGTFAGFASTSLTPTLPSGYSYKRRLGSVRTDGSAHILAFTQLGDTFLWTTTVPDATSAAQLTTASLYTLTVPPGVQVEALTKIVIRDGGSASAAIITSPDESDQTSTGPFDLATNGSNGYAAGDFVRRTNTSAQIRARAVTAAVNLWIGTYGWRDDRKRFA